MALPVMQFTDPMLSRPMQVLPTAAAGLSAGIGQGMNLMQQLQALQQKRQLAPLQAQLLQGQIAEEPLKQQLTEANIAKTLSSLKDPLQGRILPGAAGRAQGMQALSQMYGENSPVYQAALKDYNADMKLKMGRAQYFAANAALKNLPEPSRLQIMENYQNTQALRQQNGMKTQTFDEWSKSAQTPQAEQSGLTPIASMSEAAPTANTPVTSTTPTTQEQAAVGTQQMAPSGITQMPFGQQANQTALVLNQKLMRPALQQRMAYATNIEKTLGQMPEDAIKAYSLNPAQLASDYRKSVQDKVVTPNYAKYLKFMVNAELLTNQVRQFYGDSVQPAMMQKLQDLTNPISWRTSPKAAMVKFNALKDTLGREIQTYRDQATNPNFYSGEKESSVLKGQNVYGQPLENKAQTGWSNGMYTASDGKQYTRDQLLAMQRGQ